MHNQERKTAPCKTRPESTSKAVNHIASSSRRPRVKAMLGACMASNFWRPIVQAQLAREHARDAGGGETIASAQVGAAGGSPT